MDVVFGDTSGQQGKSELVGTDGLPAKESIEAAHRALEAKAYPVTRVYCSDDGIVCLEREGTTPIRLNELSPKRSRIAALKRCQALLELIPEHDPARGFPISDTGKGLTYSQYREQTYVACLQSNEIEARRVHAAEEKRRRYGL